jgi:hypothetical protein
MTAGRFGTLLLILVLTAACTTSSDEAVFDEIGVTRLILVDPGLTVQSVKEPDNRYQVAVWDVQSATLLLDDHELDLLGGEPCRFVDTLARLSTGTGACRSGVVIGSSGVQAATLTVAFTMELRRAEPVVVLPGDDSDGDGIPNDGDGSGSAFDAPCTGGATAGCDDNCPLVANADQADKASDGIGNACVVKSLSGALPDNDADGIVDPGDNCVGVPNPLQANTGGIPPGVGDSLGDFIGDACTEETARVHLEGDLVIHLGPETLALLQPEDAVTFLTIDLNDQRAISCNWDFGVCTLERSRVRICVSQSIPVLGCPAD